MGYSKVFTHWNTCRNVFLHQLSRLCLLPLLQNTLKLLICYFNPDNCISLKIALFLNFADPNFVFIFFDYSEAIEVNEALKVDAKTHFYSCPNLQTPWNSRC